jgi:hypothetical protein
MNYKGSNKFGVLPRRTVIANQPHMLAYINPQEEMLLRQLGGTGQAGPMGVPAYPPGDGGFSPDGGGGYGGGGGFGGFGGSEGRGDNYGGVDPGLAAAARAQQQASANEAAMAAADAAIAEQMAAAAQEKANATAMAEAEAEAIAIQDPSDIPTGSVTTSIVGTPMFENMRNLMAQEEAKNNIGSSGYVSVDAIANTGINPETNYGDANPNSSGAYFDAFGNAYNTQIEAEVADAVGSGYNDVPDMGGNTFEDYESEYGTSPDFTNSGDFDPSEFIGGPGDAPDNVTATNTATQTTDANKYFNLFRSTAPSSWLRNSIYNAYGTGPDFNVDVYQAADGSLRFTETDQLVPEEYLKYIPYAKKTMTDSSGEELEQEEEA